MEKDDNTELGGFLGVDFNHHAHEHDQDQDDDDDHQLHNQNPHQMVNYSSSSFDKLSFADVMQFADAGQKLGLNHGNKIGHDHDEDQVETSGIDPVYFLKFPVLNEGSGMAVEGGEREEELACVGGEVNISDDQDIHKITLVAEGKNKRKRPRSIKSSEEVESQRMTHIAVERNRRKQMNEHLRVLRSLMPGSYVQRGDQASIIGGAIEFVRELEQLLQCLESQKQRRLYGDAPRVVAGDSSSALPMTTMHQAQPLASGPPVEILYQPPPEHDQMRQLVEYEGGLNEETAHCKSSVADIEVRVLGFDAMIKILCRIRGGQLVKTIAALEDLQFDILHTNITTIEQTVLYSFNVKAGSNEVMFSAEEIANSILQFFSFVHATATAGI